MLRLASFYFIALLGLFIYVAKPMMDKTETALAASNSVQITPFEATLKSH